MRPAPGSRPGDRQAVIPNLEAAETAQLLCPGAVGSLHIEGTSWLQDQVAETGGRIAAGRGIRGPELSLEPPEDFPGKELFTWDCKSDQSPGTPVAHACAI